MDITCCSCSRFIGMPVRHSWCWTRAKNRQLQQFWKPPIRVECVYVRQHTRLNIWVDNVIPVKPWDPQGLISGALSQLKIHSPTFDGGPCRADVPSPPCWQLEHRHGTDTWPVRHTSHLILRRQCWECSEAVTMAQGSIQFSQVFPSPILHSSQQF